MYVIFTGANYWKVKELPKISEHSDGVVWTGYRWIKGNKSWSAKCGLFTCMKGFQVLTAEEVKQQGLEGA